MYIYFATFAKQYTNGKVTSQKYLKNCSLYFSPLLTPKMGTCPHFECKTFGRLIMKQLFSMYVSLIIVVKMLLYYEIEC